jgi:hypothetical protein
MDTNRDDENSDTIQYLEPFEKYLGNEWRAIYWLLHIMNPNSILINYLVPSAIDFMFGQLAFDPYHLSSND